MCGLSHRCNNPFSGKVAPSLRFYPKWPGTWNVFSTGAGLCLRAGWRSPFTRYPLSLPDSRKMSSFCQPCSELKPHADFKTCPCSQQRLLKCSFDRLTPPCPVLHSNNNQAGCLAVSPLSLLTPHPKSFLGRFLMGREQSIGRYLIHLKKMLSFDVF